ncbi:serine protease 7-like [Rhagoletis pomonella]|uniref:serine protease 7-like n=1 Tax=Rhagoletis pomonella TaxID=28610 RepID=UPI00178612C4|nr:serine protease 7-like [Rhagoletis pomonella]
MKSFHFIIKRSSTSTYNCKLEVLPSIAQIMVGLVLGIDILLLAGVFVIASDPTAVESATKCLNPNQNEGHCISIYDCKSLSFVLRKQLTAQYRFVRFSQCDGGADATGKFPFVCCTNDTDFRDSNADWQQRIIFPDTGQNGRPDPGRQNVDIIEPPRCGALTISNKIYGGEEAEITEFSWMVKLEYRTGKWWLCLILYRTRLSSCIDKKFRVVLIVRQEYNSE